jgi:hypothetical protein
VATNLGVQGLFIFLGLVVSIIRSFGRTRRKAEDLIAKSRKIIDSAGANDESETQIRDLVFIRAVSVSMMGFMVTRLTLGIFGHDLYEIYWWFSAGMALALERLVADIDEPPEVTATSYKHRTRKQT